MLYVYEVYWALEAAMLTLVECKHFVESLNREFAILLTPFYSQNISLFMFNHELNVF